MHILNYTNSIGLNIAFNKFNRTISTDQKPCHMTQSNMPYHYSTLAPCCSYDLSQHTHSQPITIGTNFAFID